MQNPDWSRYAKIASAMILKETDPNLQDALEKIESTPFEAMKNSHSTYSIIPQEELEEEIVWLKKNDASSTAIAELMVYYESRFGQQNS
ncbi:MAG: hypothetical protein ACK59C_00695 [Holosporales bacterium]|jgi:hypothetical protein